MAADTAVDQHLTRLLSDLDALGNAPGYSSTIAAEAAFIIRTLRTETIEMCAKVADDFYEGRGGPNGECAGSRSTMAGEIAKSIRALSKTQEVK